MQLVRVMGAKSIRGKTPTSARAPPLSIELFKHKLRPKGNPQRDRRTPSTPGVVEEFKHLDLCSMLRR